MANITHILRLFHFLMFTVKCTGLRRFYYDSAARRCRMFYMGNRRYEAWFSILMYIIIFVSALAYMFLRMMYEVTNYELNELENGVRPQANFMTACVEWSVTVLMLVCLIQFFRNQQNFVVNVNVLLTIHNIVISLRKGELKCSKWLLILSYVSFAQLIGIYLYWIPVTIIYNVADVEISYLSLIKILTIGIQVLYDLHFQLLSAYFVLLTSYYRHFNDFLLYGNRASKKYSRSLQKLVLLLPKLQTVQHTVAAYFPLQFVLRSLQLLRAFYEHVSVVKYDDETLHPFVGVDDADDESSVKLYHPKRVAHKTVMLLMTMIFLTRIMDLISLLSAAQALRDEKLELQQNLLDLVNFPENFQKIRGNTVHVSAQIVSQLLQLNPNAIVESNLCCLTPQSYILDFLFESEFEVRNLKSDADVFLLQVQDFKVPVSQFAALFKTLVYSAVVLVIFDAMQQGEIKKLEELASKGLLA